MYEFDVPERQHLSLPSRMDPRELFVLTVCTLGDVAASLGHAENVAVPLPPQSVAELGFSASFFDAFVQSRFDGDLNGESALFAAAAYYLVKRPGSSLVLARRLSDEYQDSAVAKLLVWVLKAKWSNYPNSDHPLFGTGLTDLARRLAFHFYNGSGVVEISESVKRLRHEAYEFATSRDLLFVDIISAIVRMRLAASAWTTLPVFTGIEAARWAPAIRRAEFPKELWPSQLALGYAGIFSGNSGVVQMPTSAGKTRAIEIVLRSAFMSGRTNLAVVVAPFRALCNEIGNSLRHAFRDDDVKVNELSDAMQLDFIDDVADLLDFEAPTSQSILVLTPEKLLYVLRQTPLLLSDIGLVVYDEGHQFDSGARGITYELLLTEIKSLLPEGAQTLLVSAVIQNARAIGEWLVGKNVQVVNGSGLLPTTRSVAFASWLERNGQLMFFESDNYREPDYFVPRVIEQQSLLARPGERVSRVFPKATEPTDIALYLGLKLVSKGSVAIFCGRKDTASRMASRAIDVYSRGLDIAAPARYADPDELRRMKNLVSRHFGEGSDASRAADLGIFIHHGTTPQGLRLSIEHAMQQGRLNFVACTSTLAQGVNLPIRYLIVSGIYQAGERIKVRDFQNLIGRAGRSGMHTEGLVIFPDPSAYDTRNAWNGSWKFSSSVELLSPDRAEVTTSSLLEILSPINSKDGRDQVTLEASELCRILLLGESEWLRWASELVRLNPRLSFDVKYVVSDLRKRRRLITAIESYLMANRGDEEFGVFKEAVESLASGTLAYHLASEELRQSIKALFVSIANYVEVQEPGPQKQLTYSRTLLGVSSARDIEQWVSENRFLLATRESNAEWLEAVWPLLAKHSESVFFNGIRPETLSMDLAKLWLDGEPYEVLFARSIENGGTKPWGETRRRSLSDDDIIGFCENTLGFECSLILAAVSQFLLADPNAKELDAGALAHFQKSIKYGLPDRLSIAAYERGFSDRVLAGEIGDVLRANGVDDGIFAAALESNRQRIEALLADYPTYFASVLAARVA